MRLYRAGFRSFHLAKAAVAGHGFHLDDEGGSWHLLPSAEAQNQERYGVVVRSLSDLGCCVNNAATLHNRHWVEFAKALAIIPEMAETSATSYHALCIHMLRIFYWRSSFDFLMMKEIMQLRQAVALISVDGRPWPEKTSNAVISAIGQDPAGWWKSVSAFQVNWDVLHIGLLKEIALVEPRYAKNLHTGGMSESWESRIPPYTNSCNWVKSRTAADIDGLAIGALKNYRGCSGVKQARWISTDGRSGVDADGRIWRKLGELPGTHPKYYRPSLLNCHASLPKKRVPGITGNAAQIVKKKK
jgi:hypothetical protein